MKARRKKLILENKETRVIIDKLSVDSLTPRRNQKADTRRRSSVTHNTKEPTSCLCTTLM